MKSNTSCRSITDALFEEPGPKTQRRIKMATIISLILLVILMVFIVRQFYITGQLQSKYWSFFLRYTTWKFLGIGLWGTVEAAAVGGLIALFAGFLLMIGRISKYKLLNLASTIIIEFTRGVPTLLFIYFFFLVIPQTGIKMDALWKVVFPVAISACGVVAEVLRSGVNAVPKGQREAAISLGLSETKTFIKIIFPQAVRFVIPALISELVIVVKDTTFAYVVSFPDLMQNAKVLISNYDAMLSLYLVVAIIYIIINYLLNKLSLYIAGKMNVAPVNMANI